MIAKLKLYPKFAQFKNQPSSNGTRFKSFRIIEIAQNASKVQFHLMMIELKLNYELSPDFYLKTDRLHRYVEVNI
jgi:hypothetical protein